MRQLLLDTTLGAIEFVLPAQESRYVSFRRTAFNMKETTSSMLI